MVRAMSIVTAKNFRKIKIDVVTEKTFPKSKEIISFEDEWLEFRLIEEKPKTSVFSVRSKCSNCELGKIKWYPQWRHYCFFPTIDTETVHSDRCLLSISEFITNLNTKHKGGKRASPHA